MAESSSSRSNRRKYLRYQDNDVNIVVRPSGLLGRFQAKRWPLIDFNRYGLSFLCDEPREPEMKVMLDIDAQDQVVKGVPALIRVSLQHPEGWRVGVEFTPDELRPAAAEKLAADLHKLEVVLKRR